MCIAGIPPDDDGDRPWGLKFAYDPYPSKWIKRTGLNPHSLFHDPVPLQHLKRSSWRMAAGAKSFLRRLRSAGPNDEPTPGSAR